MASKQCVECGWFKTPLYRHPEDPELRICRACKNRRARRARGLRTPGPKPDPSKLRSRYNLDNPKRLKSSPDNRRRARSEVETYEFCVRNHPLTPENSLPPRPGKNQRLCRICSLIHNRRTLYGIEPEDVDFMLKEQDYACWVCRRPFVECETSPHVDHDHSNGQVRGMLCHRCKTGLGFFDDSSERLLRATRYLENSPFIQSSEVFDADNRSHRIIRRI